MKKTVEIILALTLMGGALAFGGVQSFAYSILEFVVFGLLFLVLAQQTHQGEIRLPLPIWPVLFAGVVVRQLIPLPVALVGKISPHQVVDTVKESHIFSNY